MSNALEIKKLWKRRESSKPLLADEIKLSTVNVSGIYLPPSPSSSEDQSPTNDYFGSDQNFYIPRSDKLTYKRQLYTPSQII